MRKAITLVLAVLALIGSASLATAGSPSPAPVSVRPCQVLRTLPAYTYSYQGARVREPAGTVRFRQLTHDLRGARLQSTCRTLVVAQVRHRGDTPATLAVLRELGFR